MIPASPPLTPTIPAPAVIVRDVAVAGLLVGVLAGVLGAWTVMAGSAAAVLLMGSMAWVVSGGNPSRILLRMLLQWMGAMVGSLFFCGSFRLLLLCWGSVPWFLG